MLALVLALVSFQRVPLPEDVPALISSAIAQDAQGFLWIGTQDGLVRYDGASFRVFESNPADPQTLGGNYVRTLLAARDGRVWAGSFSGGLSVFDPRTGKFTRYRHDPRDGASLAHDRVEGLAEDRDGAIWAATNEGLDRLRDGRFEHFLQREEVRGLLVDSKGRVWAGTRAGLYVRDGGAFVQHGFAGQYVTRLFEDSRGRIFAGTAENGGAVVDGPKLALTHFWVYGFAEVNDELWVATFGGGIDVLDAATLKPKEHLHHDAADPASLGSDRIGAIATDRSGLVWVGTWGAGIAKHDPSTRAFTHLRTLSHPAVVRALELSTGEIWAGTNGNGIDVLDQHLAPIGGIRKGVLADGAVTCLAEGPDGARWVATLDGTLHRFHHGVERYKDGMPRGPVRTIAFGGDGIVWAGAAEGLARIDPRTHTVQRFAHRPGDDTSLSGRAVEALAFTRDGTLWIGTENGLDALAPGGAIRHYQMRDGLPDNWVPDLMVAHDGTLWVATPAGAATLQGGRFVPVPGLPPRPVESILQDAEGQVWLGGRIRVDPRTFASRVFGPADGDDLGKPFIASRSRMRDGRLMFGTPDGLMVVDPRAITEWKYEPQIAVTAIDVAGAPRDALRLAPGERTFRVEFAALDLSAPEKLRYRYRLEGFDSEWQTASHRAATYTNLPPGDYTLRVEATNRAGVYSRHALTLPVHVAAAFHQTRWFLALCALAALALLSAAWALRVAQLRKRSAELERIVAARTAELAEANARLADASLTDPLTGARNRRFFEQAIGADVALAQRNAADLVFFVLDLDHFKSVNDRYGHAAGDAVLVEAARRLQACVRVSDYVVRWGGEEFLVVARFVDRASAPGLAEKLRAEIAAKPFALPDGTQLACTVSIGFAAGRDDVELLVKRADGALYESKRGGRNRCSAAA